MKISLNWLREYVHIDQSPEQVGEIFSDLGFPVEEIEYLLKDTVLDLEVTSNRGDCLGHIGMAREFAVATGRELKLPQIDLAETDADCEQLIKVEISEPSLCGRYTGRYIEGVKVGPSPDWMRDRLEAVGIRSVNNVVDATNYAMMETGQPPHAFDYDKISSGKIIVRRAKKGEKLVSIDETDCKLTENMLIIADENGPVAIAGVMGGLDTEISESSTKVLLEDAQFDPVSVRTTGRSLGISSEAGFRFERKVDIEMIDWASKRTAELIIMAAGGRCARGAADAYPGKPQPQQVQMRLARLKHILGMEIGQEKVMQIFVSLGFEPTESDGVISCTVPSWRHDIEREADLIEEVIRVYGYNKVPTESKISIEIAPVEPAWKFSTTVGEFLNGCGYYETITTSFDDEKTAKQVTGKTAEQHLQVTDVSRKGAGLLRQSLLGSLMGVMRVNVNAGNSPCRLYEIAHTFETVDNGGSGLDEKAKIGILCDRELRELKGVLVGLIKKLNPAAEIVCKPCETVWSDTAGEIFVEGKKAGVFGLVNKSTAESLEIKNVSLCGAELDFDVLMKIQREDVKIKQIPKYPAIVRDLSLIVDEAVKWSQIEDVVRANATDELETINFVDIYRGKPIAKGRKSVTLSLSFRDEDGTLRHEKVDEFENSIVKALVDKLGGELRTVGN